MDFELEELYDLARALMSMGDRDLVARNLTACLFAVAFLTNESPKSVLRVMQEGLPSDEEWHEALLPLIRQRSEEEGLFD